METIGELPVEYGSSSGVMTNVLELNNDEDHSTL